MNVLKKLFLFAIIVLAVAWPLQPQRANRQDRECGIKPPGPEEHQSAAAPAQWARRYYYYHGPGEYLPATAMQQTPDGGYIVAGEALEYDVGLDWAHIHVWKLDSQGAVEWSTYLEQDVWWGGFSFARGVVQTPDGGYVVAGYLYGPGYWLIKLSATGSVEWQKQSRGLGSAYALFLARDGGFILAGRLEPQGLWIMKLLSDGEVEWQKQYHEQGLAESAYAIAQTPEGGYIAVGSINASGGADWDVLVLKLDPVGGVEWQRRFSEPGGEWASSVQLLADGSYIVGGTSGYVDSYSPEDALVMKLASDGSIIWCRAYTGLPTYYGGASEVRQTPDGGFVLACPSALIKLDAYGDIIWQRTYWGMDYYPPYSYKTFFNAYVGQPTPDGNLIFAGRYHGLAVFKTDSQGIIAGCPLLHDSSCTVVTPMITENNWSPTVTSPSGGSTGAPFVVQAYTPVTEAVCLPTFFELTIAAGPGGTTKPEPATHVYAGGSSVKVYALPDERHVFSYWSGDVPENKRQDNPVRIDMDDHKSIQAYFARPNFQLTISAGAGGTTDPPPGVHTYAGDTIVKIEALPDANHYFTSWTGDVPEEQRGQNPVMIAMDSDKAVAANFLARIFPPLDLRVETKENRSLFQVEYINILTWRPNPKNIGILKYRVYELRGGNLILLAETAVGTETYWHRGVEKGKTYTYVVKAVGNDGREGEPGAVTVTVS